MFLSDDEHTAEERSKGRKVHPTRKILFYSAILLLIFSLVFIVIGLLAGPNQQSTASSSSSSSTSSSIGGGGTPVPNSQPTIAPSPTAVITDVPSPSPIDTTPVTDQPSIIPRPPTGPPTRAPATRPSIVVTPTVAPISPVSAAPISDSIAAEVEVVLRSVAIFGGSEFDDSTSYQSKALKWTQTDVSIQGQSRWSRDRWVQRYALACIYYATNAVSHKHTDRAYGGGIVYPWEVTTDWLSINSECSWFRVTCNSNVAVVELNLYKNRLTGSLPPEITLLIQLTKLDVRGNKLWNVGDTGHEFLTGMLSLKYLYYENNYFEYDGIPTQLAQVVNLREYDCSYNLYSGSLTGDPFVGLNYLEFLDMSGNDFNSSVPLAVSTLPNLKRLHIEGAFLTGSLFFLTNMNMISEVSLDFNNIQGRIPSKIGLLQNLVSVSMSNNELTGRIPSEIGALSLLEQLSLYNNTLRGQVPSSLGNLLRLSILNVDRNDLTGSVPSQVCNLETSGSLVSVIADCEQSGIVCTCCDACR